LNNTIELLRLKQSLWERYFYYFDSFWYTCQTPINDPEAWELISLSLTHGFIKFGLSLT